MFLQVDGYNKTVQENIRLGKIPPPTSKPVLACKGSFSTEEFILFIIGAFVLGILGTSCVAMWLMNLRRISEKDDDQSDCEEENGGRGPQSRELDESHI